MIASQGQELNMWLFNLSIYVAKFERRKKPVGTSRIQDALCSMNHTWAVILPLV